MSVRLEACVDSVASARAAERGGASRLELCDGLHDGGTTPSAGMVAAVAAVVAIPVYVILRPRGGDFVYADDEMDVMRRDARLFRGLGAAGIVVGILRSDLSIDVERTRSVMDEADGLPTTFHRAFDLTPSLDAALEALVGVGVERVLTSGGAASALLGVDGIRRMVERAGGRLAVMAGGGLREDNIAEVVRKTGVSEVHARGTREATGVPRRGGVTFRKPLPRDEDAWDETDEARIATLLKLSTSV